MDWMTSSPPIIRDYLVYLETIMGRSSLTVNEYYLDLRTFFRFIVKKRKLVKENVAFEDISIDCVDLDFISAITRGDILDYLLFAAHSRPKYHKSAGTAYGNSAKTRARKISTLRNFFKYYCDKMKLIPQNPASDLDTPSLPKQLPKFLSLQESLDLLSNVKCENKERDYCIITLILNCGLRVSEVAGLDITDISDESIRVLGKGNKERVVYLNDACKAALKEYLPHRIKPLDAYKNALLISRQRRRISPQTIKLLVNNHLRDAGLSQKHCSVHKLRHTAATLMYQNGVDVRTLKEVLGHESLDTTMIYTHVIDQNMKDAAKQNPLSAVKPPKEE